MKFCIFLCVQSILGVFLLLPPFLGLLKEIQWTSFLPLLQDPLCQEILLLTVTTSLISTVIATGIGLTCAYLLTYFDFPGKNLVDSFTTLPIVLPPSVAGYLLLLAFGRFGLIGHPLYQAFHWQILFTTPAIVIAQTFVILPFIIRSVKIAFEAINPNLEKAAYSFGCTRKQVFFMVQLPLVKSGLLSGITMAFARAMGEFGATVMVAGTKQTIPIAIYAAANSGERDLANMLSLLLIVFSLTIIYGMKKIKT